MPGILQVAGAGRGWPRDTGRCATEVVDIVSTLGAARRLNLLAASLAAFVQIGDFVWARRRHAVGPGSVVNPSLGFPVGGARHCHPSSCSW
jgi:hypothetical protein